MVKKILFLGHNASRTGAPIVFLNFIKWFKEHNSTPFEIILGDGGPLGSEYKALAQTTILNQGLIGLIGKKFHKLGGSGVVNKINSTSLKYLFAPEDVGLIYSNTVTNAVLLNALSYLHCPVISHVHELENWITSHVGLSSFNVTKDLTDCFIAVSDCVRQNLTQNHQIPSEKVNLIYEFIDIAFSALVDIYTSRKQICRQLGLPDNAMIVGGSGTTDWRKGPDLFIQMAQAVLQHEFKSPVYFIWVGGENEGRRFQSIQKMLTQFCLEDNVLFLGVKNNPLNYYAAFDIFALTSREDPFPLVMLEAASLSKPIVCFDGSGGAKEFVEPDCGIVSPYLDTSSMAESVVILLHSPDLRQQMGHNSQTKVKSRNDIRLIAPQIVEVIERYI